MENSQPTQEVVKEFWEWCGLWWGWNHNPDCHCGAIAEEEDKSWHYFDEDKGKWCLATRCWHDAMPVNIKNLFRWAMPIVQDKEGKFRLSLLLEKWIERVATTDANPAISLYELIVEWNNGRVE